MLTQQACLQDHFTLHNRGAGVARIQNNLTATTGTALDPLHPISVVSLLSIRRIHRIFSGSRKATPTSLSCWRWIALDELASLLARPVNTATLFFLPDISGNLFPPNLWLVTVHHRVNRTGLMVADRMPELLIQTIRDCPETPTLPHWDARMVKKRGKQPKTNLSLKMARSIQGM